MKPAESSDTEKTEITNEENKYQFSRDILSPHFLILLTLNFRGDLHESQNVKQIHHNYTRPHQILDGDTLADRSGIKIQGNNKWKTIIQNAISAPDTFQQKTAPDNLSVLILWNRKVCGR